MKTALTIAGFDPSSGAGLQADLKVFRGLGFYGLSVVTAITVQNSRSVEEVFPVDGGLIYRQLSCLAEDFDIDCVKIGMLFSEGAVEAVLCFLSRYEPKIVVLDPVIRSSSGKSLIEEKALKRLIEDVLPKVTVATPNIPEATAISNIDIRSIDDMKGAAHRLVRKGLKSVVITGGHFDEIDIGGGSSTLDLVFDGVNYLEIWGDKRGGSFHGTGCIYSSALTVFLAKGYDLFESSERAKGFVKGALKDFLSVGKGMRLFK